MKNKNKAILYNGDVLEQFKNIEDNSVDLVLMDPPYNISVKNKSWDKWKKETAYIDFMGEVFKECQRVLKSNGSMYWFHNDFKQYTKLHNFLTENTEFKFNSKITWVKPNFRPISWKNPSNKNKLRSWFNITEEIFYYTFEDGTGLNRINNDNLLFKEIRDYFKEQRKIINNISYKEINKECFGTASNGGGMASNILTSYKQGWTFPTKEKYEALQILNICKKPYSELRQEYEEQRLEYEEQRYTHNLDKEHNNIWYSESKKNSGVLHPTQKPLDILERIIKTSSKEDGTVLDCFMGTGSTGVACNNLNRKFIGIERDEEYFSFSKDRIIDGLTDKEIKDKIKEEKELLKKKEIEDEN